MPDFTLPKGTVLRRKAGMGKATEYTVERVLGQGGFGVTYLASNTITIGNIKQKMLFAIKEFFVQGHCYRDDGDITMRYSPAAKQEVEDSRKEFIAEARRLNEICKDTRHVVDVNEVFEANNTAYYVMEYLSGGSLRDLVAQKREGLPEKKACDYLLPVAEAVAMIHESHRLLHCDISPDNIMLRRDDDGTMEPVLIDFGESRHFNKSGGLTTKHDSQGCKDGYVPQEQYRGITSFDPRIDVYALAATLYYLVVGHNPKSAWDITPDDIEQALPAGLSDTLRAAILHGMARDKDARTATVRDFIDEVGAKKPRGQLIPDELPVGFLLGNADTVHSYRIVSEGNKEPFYIHYKVVRDDSAETGEVSGRTKRGQYDLYEFYDSNAHERQADRTVQKHGDDSAAERKFVDFCGKKTKGAIDDAFTPGDDYAWHSFDANNTHYLVLTHLRKPFPWEKITKAASYALKGILAAAVLAGVIYLGILGWNAASGLFSKKSSEPVAAVKTDTENAQPAQSSTTETASQESSVDTDETPVVDMTQQEEQANQQEDLAKKQQEELAKKQQEELAKKQQEELAKKQQEAQKKQQEELAKKQEAQKKQQEVNRQCDNLLSKAQAAYQTYYKTYDSKYLNQANSYINQIGGISQEYAGKSNVRSLRDNIQRSLDKQKW